jgi:MFS family permease
MELSKSRKHVVYTISVIGFIFALHVVIPTYSNSSFLNIFADENTIGLIYMAGAALSIFTFLITPSLIRSMGNYKTIFFVICAEIAVFIGLITSTSPIVLSILFIIQFATSSLIGFCLDVFLEGYTAGQNVGTVRGVYMTTINCAWLIGPIIGTTLINGTDNYRNTYIASLAILFPLLYLVYRNFNRFHDPNYAHPSPWQLIKVVFVDKNLTKIFYANLVLQVFYSWMVVYSPIYLNKNIGFSWEEIGIILVIMLLPFPLIEYPLGRLADNKYGEKRIMAIGFLIISTATAFLSFISIKILFIWALSLFITRVGAAMVEIMLETYIYKSTTVKDITIISSFRLIRPVSFFFSSLIMIIGLMFFDYRSMFSVLGLFVFTALLPILTIKDIKK